MLYQLQKKRQATRRLQVHGSLIILIISLERFGSNNEKIGKKVSFPMALNIAKDCHVLLGPSIPKYNLVSLVCHMGDYTRECHYIACTKTHKRDLYGKDDSVKLISVKDLKQCETHIYILFYIKESMNNNEMWYDVNRCIQIKDSKANICAKCDIVSQFQVSADVSNVLEKRVNNLMECVQYVKIGLLYCQFAYHNQSTHIT